LQNDKEYNDRGSHCSSVAKRENEKKNQKNMKQYAKITITFAIVIKPLDFVNQGAIMKMHRAYCPSSWNVIVLSVIRLNLLLLSVIFALFSHGEKRAKMTVSRIRLRRMTLSTITFLEDGHYAMINEVCLFIYYPECYCYFSVLFRWVPF